MALDINEILAVTLRNHPVSLRAHMEAAEAFGISLEEHLARLEKSIGGPVPIKVRS